MLSKGNVVICAYAGQTDKLTTHQTYIVEDVLDYEGKGSHINVVDLQGNIVKGDYHASRFMLKDSMVKQVLENARND